MICDCHLRIEFSSDSNTSINPQIEETIRLGMKEMCITDRHDYDSGFCSCGFILDVPAYLTALRMLRADYGDRVRINIGVELGLQEHLKRYLEHFIKRYGDSSDFIIGSSHFVKSMDPYDLEYRSSQDEVTGFGDFSEASLMRVRDLYHTFDSFDHLDYAARYAPHRNNFYDYRHLNQWIDSLLKVLIRNGKSLECNAGGFKCGLGQPSPCRGILMRYRELGGEVIAIESNIHTSEYMGYAFGTCRELLLDCGYKYFTVYHGRKPGFIPL